MVRHGLYGDNQYACLNCGKDGHARMTDAAQRLDYTSTSRTLMFHLLQFKDPNPHSDDALERRGAKSHKKVSVVVTLFYWFILFMTFCSGCFTPSEIPRPLPLPVKSYCHAATPPPPPFRPCMSSACPLPPSAVRACIV
jgi:hypothetical protein